MSPRFACATALVAAVSLSGAAFALDLDELRKAVEPALKDLNKPKNGEAQPAPEKPSPAKTETPSAAGKQPARPAADGQAEKPAAEAKPAKPARTAPAIPMLGEVPLEDEVKIGREVAGNLLGAAPLVKDPALQRYVNRVGRWVASQSTRPDLKWTVGVIESSDINAFAAPGGYVFITRGLYSRLKDEAELAGVLAHEVAHVQQKHHLKVIQKQQMIGLGTELLKKEMGDERTMQRLLGSGAEILARGLDKTAEFEADRIGVVLAARAGYDPYGLPSVLQTIGAVSTTSSGSVALLFKTHPHPDERLVALGEAMGERLDGLKNSQTLGARLYQLK